MGKVAVFGATGKTGRLVVQEALGKGHSVVVLARQTPEAFPGVEVVLGNVLEPADVERALQGATAAISALGPRPPFQDIFCTRATQNIVAAMSKLGLRRLVCITGAMVGDYPKQRSPIFQWFTNLYRRQNPQGAADRVGQEEAIVSSSLDWTIVKPPRLSDGPKKGAFKAGEQLQVGMMSSISRADLAAFMVRILEPGEHIRQKVFIRY